MTETTKALRSKRAHIASRQWVNRWGIPGLLCTGLTLGFAAHAQEVGPIANKIYSNCTFTIDDLAGLTIPDLDSGLLSGGELQASYIIIYVRENPNDGQEIFEADGEALVTTNTFTGPILCTNSDSDIATPTTEDTLIAPSGTVNILGAEEASHLQYEPASGDPEKRVCHTVAGNTDCFLIKPNP
jgi:hypothetical protein